MGISSGELQPLPTWPCPHAQVAAEVLEELCGQMGILDPEEVQEFALFLIKGEGEPPRQAGFRGLGPPLIPGVGGGGKGGAHAGPAGLWAGQPWVAGRAVNPGSLAMQVSWCGP